MTATINSHSDTKSSRQNHLLEPIACLLKSAATPVSEYQLMQQLQGQGWLELLDSSDSLALYSVHFLIYNALYQLRDRYQAQGQYLYISALAIEIITPEKSSETSSSNQLSSDSQTDLAELAAYYLDWQQLEAATRESVEQLLQSFWKRYVEQDDLQLALEVLGVSDNDTYQHIRQRYRQLAMQHHPDRGGNQQDFQRIQQAFALIRQHFGQ